MDDLTFTLARSKRMMEEDLDEAREAFRVQAAKDAKVCPGCNKPVKHRAGTDWCVDRKMSEATLQQRVRGRAERRGWTVKHVGKGMAAFDAEGNPIWVSTAKSFPDLFLLHERRRAVLAIELKKEEGEFEPGQLEYLRLLNLCGIPAVVVRPSDLRLGRVNAILEGR